MALAKGKRDVDAEVIVVFHYRIRGPSVDASIVIRKSKPGDTFLVRRNRQHRDNVANPKVDPFVCHGLPITSIYKLDLDCLGTKVQLKCSTSKKNGESSSSARCVDSSASHFTPRSDRNYISERQEIAV